MPLIFRLVIAIALLTVVAGPTEAECVSRSPPNPTGATTGRTAAAFALAGNGRLLAITVSDRDFSGVFAYEIPSGKLLWARDTGTDAADLAISGDGAWLAAAYRVRPVGCPHVELRSAANGEERPLEDKADLSSVIGDSAEAVTFSADGAMIAAALRNDVRIWRTVEGKNLTGIEPPGFEARQGVDLIGDLAFSPDGAEIAGAGTNSPSVYLWRIDGAKMVRRFTAAKNAGEVGSVIFSRDGSLLAVGTTGPTKLFRHDGTFLCTIPNETDQPIGPVAFAQDRRLWISGPDGLQQWTCTGANATRIGAEGRGATDAAFMTDYGRLVTLSIGAEWRQDARAPAKATLVDAKSGETIAVLLIPGRR
jgi:WD40 repeat protein